MSRPDQLPKVLNQQEQQSLLDQFNTRYWTPARNRVLVLVGLDAGLRVSEATGLRWEHVDLENGQLTVRAGKGARDRYVPMPQRLQEALAEWKPRCREKVGDATDLVFPTRTGNRLDRRDVWKFIKREAHNAEIQEPDRVSYHTTRHSYATDVLNETGNLAYVQRLLGHADISSTQVYLHIANGDLQEALNGFRQ